jgi:hypothetical protein
MLDISGSYAIFLNASRYFPHQSYHQESFTLSSSSF